ncbi:MAG: hypothetical protein H6707_12860 [Deltaproteobacteria bacterium]|nr:hypothetical protein [Deltaproteobacteria bacterium]
MLVGLCGCSDSAPLSLRIEGPGRYLIIYHQPGAPLQRLSCAPDAPAQVAGLACQGPDVRVPGPNGTLTIKARDYDHASVDLAEVASDGSAIKLDALPSASAEPGFRDRFAAGNEGLSAFVEFSHRAVTELGESLTVKFYIDRGKRRVFFQNTVDYPLHYRFARDVLGYAGSLAEFEAETYRGANRTGIAGTLTYYPKLTGMAELDRPLLLTFFPSDDLDPELVLLSYRLIEARLGFVAFAGATQRLFYLPAGAAQTDDVERSAVAFQRWDAATTTQQALYGGVDTQLLNGGVAYGVLRNLSSKDLETQVLSYTDIVLLGSLPNTLPIVGGTITGQLQTPLAHVNVAARARGTPNLALRNARSHRRIAPFIGKLIRFEVTASDWTISNATETEARAFWQEQRSKRQKTLPEADLSRLTLDRFSTIGWADSKTVGAKAANLGELRQTIGELAPDGFVVPFSFYQRFIEKTVVTAARCQAARTDCVDEGRTAVLCDRVGKLCEAVPGETLDRHIERLLLDPVFVTDTEFREASLNSVRHIFTNAPLEPEVALQIDQRVGQVFGAAKARLRSSTNAEDLPGFTGAGLYLSRSAYASGDGAASKRIAKVWGSVWNFRAYEERAYWNIDHRAVKMGVAVSQAYEGERANGVLITQNITDPNLYGMYVNVQRGDALVTNPVDGAVSEIFVIVGAPGGGVQVARQRYSSLSPTTPILSPGEVSALFSVATRIQQRFAPLYQLDESVLTLDLEFKIAAGGELIIKQARPYAWADH